jgi:hypothetical protein
MKKTIFITALVAILIIGCKKKTTTTTTTTPPPTTVNQQGTMAFTIGSGSPQNATQSSLSGSLLNNELNIYGATSSNIYAVNLFIPNSVGTSTLNGGTTYAYFDSNVTNTTYKTNATYTGTVVVTQYDAAGKTVSGTYSFNALQTSPGGAGTSTVSITNGSFTNVSF